MPIDLLQFHASEVEELKETDKITFIVSALGALGLESSGILFCGVEGAVLNLDALGNTDRKMTFAASYAKLMAAAEEIEANGTSPDLGYALGYAFSDKVDLPALAVYDRTRLVPQFPEEIGDETDWCEEWVSQDGGSVDKAVVAVMLFDKEK